MKFLRLEIAKKVNDILISSKERKCIIEKEIDQPVYELYGLTDEDIKIVEEDKNTL